MDRNTTPKNVAIILDGNGRWALKKGKPRTFGHLQGANNALKIAKYAKNFGIKNLVLFAFSTENWKRPKDEINYLMSKPIEIFQEKQDEIDFKVSFFGRRDRIPKKLEELINDIELKTKVYDNDFHLHIAVDYGSKEEIINSSGSNELEFKRGLMFSENIDLLIRTGGEMRLSNFLLFQSAYAELYFTKIPWPIFNKNTLARAINAYKKRTRKFGGLWKNNVS